MTEQSMGGRSRLQGLDYFWAHVTAFGALWGSLEITLGSFLHTLKLPFTGVLMATMGAAILVVQQQIVPHRGAVLATGIIAALCKSISPGGIILGPMVGILTEALIVQLVLLPFPRSALAAALAGGLCANWAAFQKIITQYVVYGGGVLKLYLALLKKAGSWLSLPPEAGWWALSLLLGIITLLGISGGLLGRKMGVESRERLLLRRASLCGHASEAGS